MGSQNKNEHIRIRITKIEKEIIAENAKKNNFNSTSEYLRFLGMNTTIVIKQNDNDKTASSK